MHVRHPVWLRRIGAPGAEAFGILFALESLARALLATVIPIEALAYLGDAQGVSVLFFVMSFVGVAGSFCVPWLVQRTARRWVFSLGPLFLILAAFCMAAGSFTGLFVGMALRVAGVVVLSICANLYIMDYIARRDFGRSEPLRLFYSAGAWTVGPFLGVYLGNQVADWLPYALSAACSLALLIYFWILRMSDGPLGARPAGRVRGPMSYIKRYFAQPRLTLAWLVSVGRNTWWVMFFVYAPIFAVTSGLGELVGGLIVSGGTAFLFAMPLWGWLVRRFGLRRVLFSGFAVSGVLTFLVILATGAPWVGAVLLVCAAVSMVSLDATGNILFLVAVRPRERAEMTTVYGTYRDAAEMVPPGVFSVLLKFFELPAVFAVSGLAMLALAHYSRRVHPRLGRSRRESGHTGIAPVSQPSESA
jgi:MFS family permease